jgi:hypothetical protein
MTKNIFYFIVAVAALAAVGGAVMFLTQQSPQQAERSPVPEERGLGSELYQQVENPAAQLPEVNPFEAQTNPFQQAQTNPFDSYTNPFE